MNKATTTDIAVVSPQDVNIAAATLDGMTFVSEAMLSGSTYSTRRITWATGNNSMWAANGKTPLENARGFLIDQPNEDELFPEDYELLDAMELLCDQGKAREVVVERLDKDRKPHKVVSWQLLTASLFVVCEGVPSEAEMKSDPECRWGVAYVPFRGRGANGKALSSEVHFLAFVKELMDAGYSGPFLFKFSSYIAPKILACLNAHQYALRFVNALRNEAGEAAGLPYYALALPIQVSVGTITAGTAESDGTKQVYYPVPSIPRLSMRDPGAAMAFLASVAITRDQAAIVEDGARVEQTRQWSIDTSKRLLAGVVVDEAITPIPGDETPPFTDADIPESLR